MGNFLVNWATILLSKIQLYGVTFDGKQNGGNKTPTATTNNNNIYLLQLLLPGGSD